MARNDAANHHSGNRTRLVLIGDKNVGKTSILNRFTANIFCPTEPSTCNAYFTTQCTEEGSNLDLEIWDTAGTEQWRSVAPFYYRNARAAIAVYDQTSQGSFNSLETWIGDLTKVAKRPIIAIAANKSDLPDRFVDLTEAEKWAQEHNYIFYQTSALTGEGIHDLFQMVVNALNHPQLPQNDALPEKQRDKKCC